MANSPQVLGSNVTLYKGPWQGPEKRIQGCTAPPFNITSAQTTVTLSKVTVVIDVGNSLSKHHLVW